MLLKKEKDTEDIAVKKEKWHSINLIRRWSNSLHFSHPWAMGSILVSHPVELEIASADRVHVHVQYYIYIYIYEELKIPNTQS